MINVRQKKRGFFITFEGGEASGKSTQLRKLADWLQRCGLGYVLSCEPGGTKVGREIRRILLNPRFKGMSPRAELFLYEADRAQHVDKLIRPAIDAGKMVVSDRFADSSTVYQGDCRGLGSQWVESLNRFATEGLLPDLTIILDVPEKVRLKRLGIRKSLDRLERERVSFHRRVKRGFLKLARGSPKRFIVIDGTQTKVEVAKQIQDVVRSRLQRRGLWRT